MTIEQARKFISSPAWASTKARLLAGADFVPYPADEVELYLAAIKDLPVIQKTIAKDKVAELKAKYGAAYPEVLSLAPYFRGKKDPRKVLFKLKYPEAYELCYS